MNLRVIKKDIEFVVNDFLTDCLLYGDMTENINEEQIQKIISDALVLANDLFLRANHPCKLVKDENGGDSCVRLKGKEVKAHYKAINKDLYEGFDSLFEQLYALSK